MLIQRLIQSIRHVPGAILRILRAILLPMLLRGANTVLKILHLRHNTPASPRMECEASQRGASYSTVPTSLAPVSSPVLLPPHHDDAPRILSLSRPSLAYVPETSFPTPTATRITTLNAIPAAPEQIQRYLRRKPMYVSGHVLSVILAGH